MKNPNKTHDLIRQNEQNVSKPQKHPANLQKNTTVYFQIGLILCLLSAYGLLEMKFENEFPKELVDNCYLQPPEETDIENFMVHQEKLAAPIPPAPELPVEPIDRDVFIDPTIVDNADDELENIKNTEQNTAQKNDSDAGSFNVPDGPPEDANVSFIRVEQVPIYPGCEKEKDNEGRKKCMSDKINKLIRKKFNTGLANDLGLSGKLVIRSEFTIDKTGKVNGLKIRAPHPELQKETQRVIDFIPEMTPGKQRDKSVNVVYDLPIIFQVQN